MSLQALMALLGHVTTEMTLRYAALAAPTSESPTKKPWARPGPGWP